MKLLVRQEFRLGKQIYPDFSREHIQQMRFLRPSRANQTNVTRAAVNVERKVSEELLGLSPRVRRENFLNFQEYAFSDHPKMV